MNNYFSQLGKSQQEEVGQDTRSVQDEMPRFVRTNATGDKIFLINGTSYHWIKTPEAYMELGGSWGGEKLVDFKLLSSLDQGEQITIDNAAKYKKDESRTEIKTYEKEPSEGKVHETIKGMTSIIIPVYLINYPVFHMTGNCIGLIREHTDKSKTPYEIILVLNGIKETIKIDNYEQTYADKVIPNEENHGFAKAVNQGIRTSEGEYIAIVNNDVLVYDHWLEDMQEALNDSLDLVMATPMYGMPYARSVESQELRSKQKGVPIKDTFSNFRDFSCVLTRKSLFAEIGTLNEEFFMYGEDLDLFRRMDEAKKKYASTKLVNTTHIISATASGIDRTPDIMNESKETLKSIWGY